MRPDVSSSADQRSSFQFTHPYRMRLAVARYTQFLTKFQFTHPYRMRRGYYVGLLRQRGHFNSRTHIGCDLVPRQYHLRIRDFNSRTHIGCDRIREFPQLLQHDFNSRTHIGCDLLCLFHFLFQQNFNSRTHIGCDISAKHQSNHRLVFQFTHPYRMRQRIFQKTIIKLLFYLKIIR